MMLVIYHFHFVDEISALLLAFKWNVGKETETRVMLQFIDFFFIIFFIWNMKTCSSTLLVVCVMLHLSLSR